jgi:hypothetical protein
MMRRSKQNIVYAVDGQRGTPNECIDSTDMSSTEFRLSDPAISTSVENANALAGRESLSQTRQVAEGGQEDEQAEEASEAASEATSDAAFLQYVFGDSDPGPLPDNGDSDSSETPPLPLLVVSLFSSNGRIRTAQRRSGAASTLSPSSLSDSTGSASASNDEYSHEEDDAGTGENCERGGLPDNGDSVSSETPRSPLLAVSSFSSNGRIRTAQRRSGAASTSSPSSLRDSTGSASASNDEYSYEEDDAGTDIVYGTNGLSSTVILGFFQHRRIHNKQDFLAADPDELARELSENAGESLDTMFRFFMSMREYCQERT